MHCQKTVMDIVSRIYRTNSPDERNYSATKSPCTSLSQFVQVGKSFKSGDSHGPMSSSVIVAGSKYIGRYLPARKPSNAMLVLVVSHIKYLKVVVANTWDKLHQGGKKSFELSPQ